MKKNRLDFKRGFSLVELIVVLSIFAILASLILPSLKKIFHSGRTIECKNNLKNTYTAMISYIEDNSNQLPGPCQFLGAVPLFILEKHKNPLFGFNNRLGFHLKEYSSSVTIHGKSKLGTWAYNKDLTCPENMELDLRGALWRRHYTFPWTGGHESNWMESKASKISYRYVFGYQHKNTYFNSWYFQFIEKPSEFITLNDHITKNTAILAPTYPIHAGSTRNTLFFDGRVVGTVPQGF